MIEIRKTDLNEEVVSRLIELSKIWDKENITGGYRANEKSDLYEPCYIALDGNKIVGYIFGHYQVRETKIGQIEVGTEVFYVEELYVIKEYRSLGIGKKLFKALEKEVKEKVKFITLSTSTKDYKRILKFYDEDLGMDFHSAFFIKEIN